MVPRSVDAHLAGEHDLVEVPCGDALDRARHGGLVVGRRRGTRHAGARHRVGVEQRHLGRRELLQADAHAADQSLRVVAGPAATQR